MSGIKKWHSLFSPIVGTPIHITSKIALSIASSFHRLVLTEPRILPDAVVAIEQYFPLHHEGVKFSTARRISYPVKYRTGGGVCFVLLPDAVCFVLSELSSLEERSAEWVLTLT
ncbi:hypothetical protein CEXT_794361 [Caerostris extrusa]|uniref:Uncharacterized protein n=1 Tax=Caerostris extrusa TaxID=172846 RepID=A0AAV4Y3Q8_CAEEX|nr:hypothetical protein CEXT_794361 [Caerostris extrusa]